MQRSMKAGRKSLLGLVAFLALTCGSSLPALAYIGPGAGLSLVGAFWGLLLAVFASLAVVIAWPLRRLLRRRRNPQVQAEPPATPEPRDPTLSHASQRHS